MKDRERRSILCMIYNLTPYVGKNAVEKKIFSSVQFNHPVVSDSSWLHGLQQARSPCPSASPGACSNSCPLSWWCHPTISSSVVPFSSCLWSFPESGSFPMSQFFTSGDQGIGVSTSTSVLLMNILRWFPLGWTDLISLQSKGLSRVFNTTGSKASILQCSAFFMVQLSHLYMTAGTCELLSSVISGKDKESLEKPRRGGLRIQPSW